MKRHKLILIDGITGSGKSTTAHFLARQLDLNQISAQWFHEDQSDHPLIYPYADVDTLDDPQQVLKFMDTYPKQWELLVQRIIDEDRIYIIESYFLQNSIRPLFQNNLDKETVTIFFHTIVEIIMPLHPLLIYFHQENAEMAIRRLWRKRGVAWKNGFIHIDKKTPYVLTNKLEGEKAVLDLWTHYQKFTNQLVAQRRFDTLIFENSNGEWEVYYQKILDYLKLERKEEPKEPSGDLTKYIGRYGSKKNGSVHRFTIDIMDGWLICYLYWDSASRLLPRDSHKFHIEAFPLDIIFHEKDSEITGFTFVGRDIFHLPGTRLKKLWTQNRRLQLAIVLVLRFYRRSRLLRLVVLSVVNATRFRVRLLDKWKGCRLLRL